VEQQIWIFGIAKSRITIGLVANSRLFPISVFFFSVFYFILFFGFLFNFLGLDVELVLETFRAVCQRSSWNHLKKVSSLTSA
jgi:hypothetical protein